MKNKNNKKTLMYVVKISTDLNSFSFYTSREYNIEHN